MAAEVPAEAIAVQPAGNGFEPFLFEWVGLSLRDIAEVSRRVVCRAEATCLGTLATFKNIHSVSAGGQLVADRERPLSALP